MNRRKSLKEMLAMFFLEMPDTPQERAVFAKELRGVYAALAEIGEKMEVEAGACIFKDSDITQLEGLNHLEHTGIVEFTGLPHTYRLSDAGVTFYFAMLYDFAEEWDRYLNPQLERPNERWQLFVERLATQE